MYQEKHTHTQNPTNIHRNQNQKMKPKKERMGERKERKKGGRKEGRKRKGKKKEKTKEWSTWKLWPAAIPAVLQPVLPVHRRWAVTGWQWVPPRLNAPTPPLHPQLHYWLKNRHHYAIHLAATSPLWVGFKANEHCTQMLLSSATIPFCLRPDLGSHPLPAAPEPQDPQASSASIAAPCHQFPVAPDPLILPLSTRSSLLRLSWTWQSGPCSLLWPVILTLWKTLLLKIILSSSACSWNTVEHSL